MNCEICKIIERHGLDPSAHDWWHCVDEERSSSSSSVFKPMMAWFNLLCIQVMIPLQGLLSSANHWLSAGN